jgi:hypothetical protein
MVCFRAQRVLVSYKPTLKLRDASQAESKVRVARVQHPNPHYFRSTPDQMLSLARSSKAPVPPRIQPSALSFMARRMPPISIIVYMKPPKPRSFVTTDLRPLIGRPHLGHAGARSEHSLLQSGQLTSAITPPFYWQKRIVASQRPRSPAHAARVVQRECNT